MGKLFDEQIDRIRQAEQSAQQESSGRLRLNEHGYLEIAAAGTVLTSELVKESSEDPTA